MIVTVYTRPDCVQCEQTKRVLDRAGVEYVDIDVREPLPAESERTVADWLRDELHFFSAPVVHVNYGDHNAWWSGFKIDKLRDLHQVHQV